MSDRKRPGSTVGPTQVADLLAALSALGAEPQRLAVGVGLPVPSPADSHARVPTAAVIALLDAAAKSLGDPLVGLHAGARAIPRGPLFYLALSTSRVSEGLRLMSRFASVSLSTLKLLVTTRAKRVEFTIEAGDPAVDASDHTVDYLVGGFLSILRRAIPGFRLLGVDLIHDEIDPKGEAERVLGCPVRFGRPHNTLCFSDETLEAVPAAASPLIARQIEKFAESLLAESETEDLGERIAAVLRRLLSSGRVLERHAVAREMHMSVRTLQRQLEREALKFKDIRDGVRLEVAQSLLANRSLNVKTVAYSVGFADTAAFSKAFTRWAGVTPTSYRRGTQ